MRLKSLTTTHFKKLGSQTFTFGPGMNIISGENAQGKSTLLQAIEASLFGVRAIPGKAEHIATWGQKKWALELHFEGKDHQHYCVIRNASTAKLVRLAGEETELVANGTTPVAEHIEGLLGLAAKDYNLFIQSRQGESTGILTFGASALNRKVEDYAGVQVIEKVQAAAQVRATRLAAGAEAKRVPEEVLAQAAADLQTAEQALNVARDAHQAAQEALEAFGEFTQPEVKDTVDAMRKEAHAADLLWAKVEAAEKAVAPAEQAVLAARERFSALSLQDVDDLVENRTAALNRGNELKGQLAALQGDKQAYTAAQHAVNRCQAALDAANEGALPLPSPEEVGNAEKALDAAELASDTARRELTEAEVKVRNLKDLAKGAKCPTCGHTKEDHDPEQLALELAEAEKLSSAAQIKAVDASKAEGAARALVKQYQETDRKARASLDAVEAAERELDKAQASFDNLTAVDESQIHDIEAQLEETRGEYATYNAAIANAEGSNLAYRKAQRELNEAESRLGEVKDSATALAKQYEDLPEPPTEEQIKAAQQAVEQYRQAYSEWKAKHDSLSMDVKERAADLRIAKQQMDNALAACERLQVQNKAADADEAMAKKYDRLVRFLREGRQGYMQQVWATILAVSSRLVHEASRGMITRILNEDGEFMFEENGIIAPSSSASGAQKGFIGTSLRVGLSRSLYGSDSLMIFDEPTEACSEQNASAMAATLATSAKQVLMITHRETDQVLANKVIQVGA